MISLDMTSVPIRRFSLQEIQVPSALSPWPWPSSLEHTPAAVWLLAGGRAPECTQHFPVAGENEQRRH